MHSSSRRAVNIYGFRFFALTRGQPPWKDIGSVKQYALTELGWGEQSWNGLSPAPNLRIFSDLTLSEKATVLHGLDLVESEKDWNEFVKSVENSHSLTTKTAPSSVDPAASASKASALSSLGNMLWSATKMAAPLVRQLPKTHPAIAVAAMAVEHLPSLLDNLADKIEIYNQVETVVYLDDSGSMSTRLTDGQGVLRSMEPLMQTRTRIVKFGTAKTVLSHRGDRWDSSLALFGWNASSGSTYMWKMIEDDIKDRYVPSSRGREGGGRLRVVIITDGHDTESPGQYRGMKGMDPMMKTLLGLGYDIEFHIVVLGDVGKGIFSDLSRSDVHRYTALAEATGGGALAISTLGYDESHPATKAFLRGVEEGGGSGAEVRERRARRQRQYRAKAKEGKTQSFEWIDNLPLPPPPPRSP
jgi:hypothetical protein